MQRQHPRRVPGRDDDPSPIGGGLCEQVRGGVDCFQGPFRVDAVTAADASRVRVDAERMREQLEHLIRGPVTVGGEAEVVVPLPVEHLGDVGDVALARSVHITGDPGLLEMPNQLLVIHGVSPWRGKTFSRVAWIAGSAGSACPVPSYDANTGIRPSVIRNGPCVCVRCCTSSRHSSGVSVSGAIGSPPASASRCVHERGTTRTSSYPPPPVAIHRPLQTSCASPWIAACAVCWPSRDTSKLVRGSRAWLSHPCWENRIVGANARTSGGTTAWKARSQPPSPVPAGRATLTAVPSAPAPPISSGKPVPGNNVRPDSCNEIVNTLGSSQNATCTPSPWCASMSTYAIFSTPCSSNQAIAIAGSL